MGGRQRVVSAEVSAGGERDSGRRCAGGAFGGDCPRDGKPWQEPDAEFLLYVNYDFFALYGNPALRADGGNRGCG